MNLPQTRRFETLTAVIVDRVATPGDLWHACHDLYGLLLDVTGLPPEEYAPEVAADTVLPTGKAIAPIDAARCLLDPFRTQAFAAAVIAAVAQRRRTEPHHPSGCCMPGAAPSPPCCCRLSPASHPTTFAAPSSTCTSHRSTRSGR